MRFLTRFSVIVMMLWMSVSISAQRPDAPAYAQRGEYAVGTRDFTLEDDTRPLTVTIWYPAQNPDNLPQETSYTLSILRYPGRALRDVLPLADGAPYPVVIFSHGSSGYRFQSTFLTEHLASHGFIVISADHPTNTVADALNRERFLQNIPANFAYRPQDVMRQIDFVDSMNADGDFSGLLNMDALAVMGHSFGGYTALMAGGAQLNFDKLATICTTTDNLDLFGNTCFIGDYESQIAELWGYDTPPNGAWDTLTDPRIQAVVALAPWNAPIISIDPSTPYPATLIIVGSADSTTPPERDAQQFYAMLPQDTTSYIEFANAGHYIFVDSCNDQAVQFGFFDSCSDDVWDMGRVHDLTNHFVTAFLLDTLKGDTTAYATALSDDFAGVTIQSPQQPTSTRPVTILSTAPHAPDAYTQGLVYHNGLFYESTGLNGQSSLREVDPQTGDVLRQVNLSAEYFAEGLALVDNRLIQITWRSNIAFVYNIETFEQIDTYAYEGEGWGLCYDDEFLYMSDGSEVITIRDPQTFDVIGTFSVTQDGLPVDNLNELECPAGDNFIVANVWQTPYLVLIDKATGMVNTRLDGTTLVNYFEEGFTNSDAVLNGSAYDPLTDTWYMTGKLWDTMFIVEW
ncbi:MAG: glutaminyl-peptide cyclotransferase [Phototrophicales bacterium]|nr:glutaminyl-peptide cyclotransferase [Phototrophicales bacterium]